MTKDDLNRIVTIEYLERFYWRIKEDILLLVNQNKKEFHTPKEFSKKTGVPYTTIINHCKTRRLKARQDFYGGSWLMVISEA